MTTMAAVVLSPCSATVMTSTTNKYHRFAFYGAGDVPTTSKSLAVIHLGSLGIVHAIGEQSEYTTRTRPQQLSSKDKGKGIMEEPKNPIKKKYQIRLDEELAFILQDEEEKEARLAREKAEKEQESNVALIEEWNDI
ncbi:hypothetical protein Tco_1296715 [Tanacetum coccineum]